MTVEDHQHNAENQDGDSAAELTETEKRVAEERSSLRAAVIHEAMRSEGEMKLQSPTASLIWSGLGAGLIAWVMCTSSIFKPEVRAAFAALTRQGGWITVMLRGALAGMDHRDDGVDDAVVG